MRRLNGPEEWRALRRLQELLQDAHAQFGHDIGSPSQWVDYTDREVHWVGKSGVLAFLGDYVLAGWPDAEQREASRDAYKVLQARLDDRGFTRHMVYPLNFRSVKLTRRMGAVPVGVDDDGFVHYILTRERFGRHGKKVAAAEGPRPQADH